MDGASIEVVCVGEGMMKEGHEVKYRFHSEGQHIFKLSFMQTYEKVGGVASGNYPTYYFMDS